MRSSLSFMENRLCMENRRFEVDKRNRMEMIICRNCAGDGKKNLRYYNKAKADKIPTEPTKVQAVRERPPVSDTSRTGQPAAARERPLSSREDTKPSGQKASVQGQSGKRFEVQATQRERVHATRQTATVQQEQRTQNATATQQTRQRQSRQRKKGRKK